MKGNVESGRLTIQDEKEFKIIFKDDKMENITLKIKSFKNIYNDDEKKQIKYDIIKGDKVYIFYEVINNENLSKLTKDLNPNFLLDINNDEYPLYKEMIDYPIIKYEIFENLYNRFSKYSELQKKILSHLDHILYKPINNQKFFNENLFEIDNNELIEKFIESHYKLYEKQLRTKEKKIEEINKKIVILKEYQADPKYKKQRTKLKSYYSALISQLNMLEGETKDKEKLTSEKKSLKEKINEVKKFSKQIH